MGEGNGTPLQYSCLENPMDGGAWWASVHGVARSRTRLSDFTLFFHFHALEKEMATHSSVLAWGIPGRGEPGGLPSMGSQSWTRLKRFSSSRSKSEIEEKELEAIIYIYLKKTNLIVMSEMVENFSRKKMEIVKKKRNARMEKNKSRNLKIYSQALKISKFYFSNRKIKW